MEIKIVFPPVGESKKSSTDGRDIHFRLPYTVCTMSSDIFINISLFNTCDTNDKNFLYHTDPIFEEVSISRGSRH